MKAPENLVKAVEHLEPQAVLLLDTNTLMDYPKLASYEIAVPGPFLLVVPQVVDNELLSLTFSNDPEKEETKQKASRARKYLGKLYERGNAADGIDVENDRWVVTVRAPRPATPENIPVEEDQIWRYLGLVDAALLRLADACAEDISDTPTVLVTKDKNLTHTARSRGIAVFSLPKLRSREALDKLLGDDSSSGVVDIDSHFSSLLDGNEERPVTISMTLEELGSNGDNLIAQGTGRLTFSRESHPFRWTYPYKNAENIEDIGSLFDMIGNAGGMPVENLDFMGGSEERIPEQVRRFACSILESAGWADMWFGVKAGLFQRSYTNKDKDESEVARSGWSPGAFGLQSPLVRARLAFAYMEAVHWGYYCGGGRLPWVWKPSGEDWDDDTEELYSEFFESCEKLMRLTTKAVDGYLSDFANAYREAFDLYEELVDRKGKLRVRSKPDPEGGFRVSLDRVEGEPAGKLETGLKWLLGVAADSWPVGHTREDKFTYSPYSM